MNEPGGDIHTDWKNFLPHVSFLNHDRENTYGLAKESI